MAILNITQANKGAEIYGFKTGETLFTDKETNCFYFAVTPNGKEIKVSKKTMRACHWGNSSTSPVFSLVEFAPAEDHDAWKAEDDKLIAARRVRK